MEYLQNITVSEFGKIKANILSNMLTAMLCMNAVSITMTVGMLDDGFEYPKNLGVAISVFSCSAAVFLFFMIKRYMETVTYRFYRIDPKQIESVAKMAKRFFLPFLIGISLNIVFACLGAVTLLIALLRQA
ncbi:MAG: hypothetical protein WCK42_09250 [Myxococcaceae bacterium]